MNNVLLKVHNLSKSFPVRAGSFSNKRVLLQAVAGVSFDLRRGETLGLVGESGCGKTTIGRALLRIYEPDQGRVFVDPQQNMVERILELDREIARIRDLMHGQGQRSAKEELKSRLRSITKELSKHEAMHDLLKMPRSRLKPLRKRMQMVFQDPWASLNPRMLIKDIIGEGPREFGTHSGKVLDDLVLSLLDRVGLPPLAAMRYAHEFSGGQRQRIGIARALALTPSLIVCDEPVSALDVSIQAQILNLLIRLQAEFGLTYIFIAHDLSVVQYISDRIAVMYLGKIVEIGNALTICAHPSHPYAVSLMKAVPAADPDKKPEEAVLEGEVPSPVNPPPGCSFHPRCRNRVARCSQAAPCLTTADNGHALACFNPQNSARSKPAETAGRG